MADRRNERVVATVCSVATCTLYAGWLWEAHRDVCGWHIHGADEQDNDPWRGNRHDGRAHSGGLPDAAGRA